MKDTYQRPFEEQRYSQEWLIFGQNLGLKISDLLDFQKLRLPGCRVLPGIAIGIEYFDTFISQNHFDLSRTSEGKVTRGKLPSDLAGINAQIISSLTPGRPYAVRSSATDERGGSGLYRTYFFTPTGDPGKDSQCLARCEKWVYASMFTNDARTYRQTHKETTSAMGILIQPVVGEVIGDFYLPLISGVLTYVNNEPYLRFSLGLGTRVVEGDDSTVSLQGEDINESAIREAIGYSLDSDGLVLEEGGQTGVRPFQLPGEIYPFVFDNLSKLHDLIQNWRELSEGAEKGFYIEFAIDTSSSPAVVLQAAPATYLPRELVAMYKELGPPAGKVLFEGSDVVNVGTRKGRGIYFVDGEGLAQMESVNKTHDGFLLVVPDTVFSQLTNQGVGKDRLGLRHWSNASAIIELKFARSDFYGQVMTVDHYASARGGQHFREVCRREDILFLGQDIVDTRRNDRVLGKPTDMGDGFTFWDVEFTMTNTLSGGRVELVGEALEKKYRTGDFRKWEDDFYKTAEAFGWEGIEATAFMDILDCFVESEKVTGTTDIFPFLEKRKPAGIRQLYASLLVVLENIDATESYDSYAQGMEWVSAEDEKPRFLLGEYLQELKNHLEQLIANNP